MLNGIFGNGFAVGLAIAAYIASWARRHTGRFDLLREILITAAVVLMLFSGEMARGTGIGHWIVSVLRDIEHGLGSAGPYIIAGAVTIALIRVGVAVGKRGADDLAMYIAFAVPFGLALFSTGPFAQLDVWFAHNAQQTAAYLVQHIGH